MTSILGSGWHIVPPASAPTIAQGVTTGGLNGTYLYKVTFVSPYGESLPGPASASTPITAVTNASLTNIPLGVNGVTGRKIYRTVASGSTYLLVATLSNNTATTYSDITADGSLGAAAPVFSTADSTQFVDGYVSLSNPLLESNNPAVVAVASGTQPVLNSTHNVVTTCPLGGQILLPPLSSIMIGMTMNIRNNGVNPCLINPSGANTINVGASLALANGAVTQLFVSSATNWQQIF